ncbi:DMT family transporter [Stutzerimonas zhaodongensis]|jgi:quaternary ammonium compound-resistance protein SugE|uniref:Guanidinium exporter n=1 Tax=Stutzerimonas zhaodongensis TaxID=1176257 RepID=A0A365PY68_9GAMM|nr:multidrug efflux SMR transporter [Stutzerimonas zhaodongensis]QWV16660.1 multidrug efflux SMR transporter [Stutzerimonas zhaodongensis]RBA61139.1 QacE family quaternary ammonium compound efflux SMR transporter [Stutzerimonas zhaodongensis]
MFSGSGGGWWFLLMAGLSEICYAAVIPKTDGFTRLWPTLYCAFFIALSLWLLAIATRTLPTGTAYAVWVGMGAVGTAICGIAFFGEPANIARVACLSLIVAGVVGLKLFSPVGH